MRKGLSITAAVGIFILAVALLPPCLAAPIFGDTPQPRLLSVVQYAQVKFAGMYEGVVERHTVGGGNEEARLYRVAVNPDMKNGAVWIYSGGVLRTILLFSGSLDGSTFSGTTRPVQQSGTYKPDNIRLDFSPDGMSVRWQHNDGTIMGSGMLKRI
jgi:hypothetical protein